MRLLRLMGKMPRFILRRIRLVMFAGGKMVGYSVIIVLKEHQTSITG